MFDRTVLEVKREFDLGASDFGAVRFEERQLTQMAKHEIMTDITHCKHELSQLEVSIQDKLVLERLLSAKDMTRYRGGFGSFGWLVDKYLLCCAQLSFDLSDKRKRENDATIQDMLKLKKMVRSAKSIE